MEEKVQQTVLVIEDDPVIQELLKLNLIDEGYTVLTADDGQEGVQIAKEARPGVILMDMRLPSITGWEATRLLKEQPETGDIPVIALTAQSTADDLRNCFEAGCDAFMTKPIQFAQLYIKIEMLIKRSANVLE